VSERLLIAGELGSRHGAAAVLVSDPANLRWLGRPGAPGETLVLCSGAVRSVGGQVPGIERALAEIGIHRGAMLAADTVPAPAPPGYLSLDLSSDLAAARMRKDAEELAAITAAATLASAGQEAVRASAVAGASEEELWHYAQVAVTAAAHELQPAAEPELLCDLLAGERSAAIDGPPGASRLAPGDPLLFDLAPRHDDYWADSCATFAVGSPSAALRARHDSVRAALDAGIAAARPGVTAGAVDAAVRGRLEADGLSCPHHSGHGVGLSAQEPPFLTPGETTPLEEGMTIAIETGAYGEGFGVRLEHLVLIEADGARPLTTHSLTLV
jgi:Xaa-Pro aminopeptidase